MRPVRQLKIITSQLELLDDLRNQLDSLLLYINNVMKIGESWIERKEDTKTFLEVNSLLVNETSNCIQKCLDIAHDNQERFETGSSNEQSSIKYTGQAQIRTVVAKMKAINLGQLQATMDWKNL